MLFTGNRQTMEGNPPIQRGANGRSNKFEGAFLFEYCKPLLSYTLHLNLTLIYTDGEHYITSQFSVVSFTKWNKSSSIKSGLYSCFTYHRVGVRTSLTPLSLEQLSSGTCSEGAVAITSNCMNLYKCNNILRFLKGIHFLKLSFESLWKTCIIILMIPLSSLNSNCGAFEIPW